MMIQVRYNLPEIIQVVSVLIGFFGIGLYRASNFTVVGGNANKILYWWEAMGWLVVTAIHIAHGSSPYLSTLFFAYNLYRWWNSGGGDGVKNFLQSLAMKPAHAVK